MVFKYSIMKCFISNKCSPHYVNAGETNNSRSDPDVTLGDRGATLLLKGDKYTLFLCAFTLLVTVNVPQSRIGEWR
jgi:hypothetical protein